MHAVDWLVGLEELAAETAERWLAAALAEAAALRQHDDSLFPEEGDQSGLELATRLRETWARWANDAELLLNRSAELEPRPQYQTLDRLAYEIGRARAMLGLTPEKIQRARRQAAAGNLISSEEVRRGLGLPLRR